MTSTTISPAAWRELARRGDEGDAAPTGGGIVETALPAASPSLEESAPGVDFGALLADAVQPEGVRDRIELPETSAAELRSAADRLVRSYTRRPGRYNLYVPVPGETTLRTDDIVDFLRSYGHEYQLAVHRAVDVRSGSILDVAEVHRETLAEGAQCAWDWTGATDWISTEHVPADTEFVFWAEHSRLDGTCVPAGLWLPAQEPYPEVLNAEPVAAEHPERAARLAGFLARALLDAGAHVRLPGGTDPGLPIVVVAFPDAGAAHAARAAVAAMRALRSILAYGERLVLIPDGGRGSYTSLLEVLDAIATSSGKDC